MRKYDSTFIIDGTLGVDVREALIEKFQSSLEKLGGKIDQIVRWGERTLAYEIKKRNLGYYVIFYYSAGPSIIEKFERELRINENILRYMTVVFDGSYPSYIVGESEKDIASSKPMQETESSETPESIEEIEKDKESLEKVEHEGEVQADDLIDENFVEKEDKTVSDSKITESDNRTENVVDKEED